MARHRRGRALRRRYGRSIGPQAITRPRPDGRFDVIVVDSRGTNLQTLARGIPYSLAKTIVKRRHS